VALDPICLRRRFHGPKLKVEVGGKSILWRTVNIFLFKTLENNIDIETQRMKYKVEEYRKALALQYDLVFGVPVQAQRIQM